MSRWIGGLRGQLIALMAGSMLATLALLAVYMVREQTALARRGIEQQALAVARSIATGGENDLLTGRLDVLESLLLRSADLPGVQRAVVMDPSGRPLVEVRRGPAAGDGLRPVYRAPSEVPAVPATPRRTLTVSGDGASLSAWEPVHAGRLLAWVRVDQDTSALNTIRQGIWQGVLTACGLALVGSLLLLHRLLRAPLAAVEQARDFAADLVQANGRQMNDAVGADEVRALLRALNRASRQLCEQRAAIQGQLSQLRLQEAQLAERNQRLSMLAALCPDGIVSFDAEDTVRFVNPAFARHFGLSPEELVGRPLSWIDERLRAASAQSQVWLPLARVFEPEHQDGGQRALVRLVRPRQVDLALLGVRSEGEAPTRLLYVRDVTHETEVDRMKSEFLSTAAHELRTPMSSIYGYAELLCERSFTPERQAVMLATIHRQSRAMIDILNELLDLARIEARQGLDFEIQAVNLCELVRGVVSDAAVPEHRAAPNVDCDGMALPVRVDPGKIGQVLRNLLSNAYKYSPRGGLVEVRLWREDDVAVLEVRDEGIGMSAEQLNRVCERFYRADISGAIPGTGLGMSIVKDIVELHGGSLALHSQLGQGTTVTVRLPSDPTVMTCLEAAGAEG